MSLAKELGMCGKGEISSGRVKPLSKHLLWSAELRKGCWVLTAPRGYGWYCCDGSTVQLQGSAVRAGCASWRCAAAWEQQCVCVVWAWSSGHKWAWCVCLCRMRSLCFLTHSEEIAAWTSYAFANVFQFWMMARKEKWAALHKSSWLGGLLSVHTEAFPITKTQQGGALYLLNMAVGKLFASRLEDRCEKRGCCRPAGPELLSELQYRLWIKASFLWALILVEGTAITK